MDSNRKSFEEFHAKYSNFTPERLSCAFDTDENCEYIYPSAREGWGYWQASRAAIEIELPKKITGTLLHGRVIANDMLHDCTTAITSHGIRIKGKTV